MFENFGYRNGKRSLIKTVVICVLALMLLLNASALAKPTSAHQAEKAVKGWLKNSPNPLKTNIAQQIDYVQTFSDDNSEPLYYVVYLQPSGFVIVAADDQVEPIIAFADSGIYDPSPNNPLAGMINADIPVRIAAARGVISSKKQDKAQALKKNQDKAKNKWNDFISAGDLLPTEDDPLLAAGVSTISDVRVSAIIQSKWNQSTECGYDCYNYYTPSNYVCGCVATMMAQVMKFHEFPTVGIGVNNFNIWIDGVLQDADTRGGDGLGGPYNWADMTLDPSCANYSDQSWEAIGALCYDAGVASHMQYASDGSGAYMDDAAIALTETFDYSNVICREQNDDIGTPINDMINPNLDAGLPTMIAVYQVSTEAGHAVVCDGYGYDSSTLYHHINYGWAGTNDLWYDLPDVNIFDMVYSCIFNIYPTGSGEIISGRVVDNLELPIEGATVEIISGGTGTTTTDAQGIYAFAKVASNTSYTISAAKMGYTFTNQNVTTGTSTSGDEFSTCGNKWAIDFNGVVSAAPQPPVANDINVAIRVDQQTPISLTAIDDGQPNPPAILSYVITTLPINGSLTDPAAGAIETTSYTLAGNGNVVTYTPDAGYAGLDSFTYAADDSGVSTEGGLSETANVSITMVEYYTELFEASDNDLAYRTLTFTPDGSSQFYNLCLDDAASFLTDPTGGATISLTNDDNQQVTLTDAEQVSIYGSSYASFYIGSNGYITFDSGDSDATETLTDHFAVKRVSALFNDLDPSSAGVVSWKQLTDRAAVTFDNVPQNGMANANSFQIELFFNGTIRITYLNIDSLDNMAGLSAGAGLADDFLETNLTSYDMCVDYNSDDKVTITDFAGLAEHWMEIDCSTSTWCSGADLDRDDQVAVSDIAWLIDYWLEEFTDTSYVQLQETFYSIADDDGRLYDNDLDIGGGADSDDNNNIALRLGDAWWSTENVEVRYKNVVSFDTTSLLPDDVVLVSVTRLIGVEAVMSILQAPPLTQLPWKILTIRLQPMLSQSQISPRIQVWTCPWSQLISLPKA